MPALLLMTKTKENRPFLTFSGHIIGPQFVAAITVFVVFTVELQHLGSLIKILLDPFQIVHQPITTCEKRARTVLHVWGCCSGVGRIQVWQAIMCLSFRTSLCPPELRQGNLSTKNAGGVQPFLQRALSAVRQGLSNLQTGETLLPALTLPLTRASASCQPGPKLRDFQD